MLACLNNSDLVTASSPAATPDSLASSPEVEQQRKPAQAKPAHVDSSSQHSDESAVGSSSLTVPHHQQCFSNYCKPPLDAQQQQQSPSISTTISPSSRSSSGSQHSSPHPPLQPVVKNVVVPDPTPNRPAATSQPCWSVNSAPSTHFSCQETFPAETKPTNFNPSTPYVQPHQYRPARSQYGGFNNNYTGNIPNQIQSQQHAQQQQHPYGQHHQLSDQSSFTANQYDFNSVQQVSSGKPTINNYNNTVYTSPPDLTSRQTAQNSCMSPRMGAVPQQQNMKNQTGLIKTANNYNGSCQMDHFNNFNGTQQQQQQTIVTNSAGTYYPSKVLTNKSADNHYNFNSYPVMDANKIHHDISSDSVVTTRNNKCSTYPDSAVTSYFPISGQTGWNYGHNSGPATKYQNGSVVQPVNKKLGDERVQHTNSTSHSYMVQQQQQHPGTIHPATKSLGEVNNMNVGIHQAGHSVTSSNAAISGQHYNSYHEEVTDSTSVTAGGQQIPCDSSDFNFLSSLAGDISEYYELT